MRETNGARFERTSGSRFVTIDSVSSRTRPLRETFCFASFCSVSVIVPGRTRGRSGENKRARSLRLLRGFSEFRATPSEGKVVQSRKAVALWRAESIVRTIDRGVILPFVSTRSSSYISRVDRTNGTRANRRIVAKVLQLVRKNILR